MRYSDYPDYELKPRHLGPEETTTPGLVFYRLFDYAHLPTLRERLWTWLRITVSGNFNTEQVDPEVREQVLALYEQIARLLEAAHLELIAHRERLAKLDREIMRNSFNQHQND